MPPLKRTGFTLIEAMVCLAIAGILLCVAGPACADLMQRSRAAAARAALLATVTQAIRHAALGGAQVVLCPGSEAAGCLHTSDWSDGWMAYADMDGDRSLDPGEPIIRSEPPLADGIHLVTSTGRRRLLFHPTGGNAGFNATFTLCDGRGASSAVALVLSNAGRLRAGKASPPAAQRCAAGGR